MAKKVMSIILYTALWFDMLVIFNGVGGMMEGKPFLQEVIKILENGRESLIFFLCSVFMAIILTYTITTCKGKNTK